MRNISAPNGWKKSYWPEPRGSSTESRRECISRLHPRKPSKPRLTLEDVMSQLAALGK